MPRTLTTFFRKESSKEPKAVTHSVAAGITRDYQEGRSPMYKAANQNQKITGEKPCQSLSSSTLRQHLNQLILNFKDIPVCQYKKTLEEEIALYGRDNLLRIYRDMRIIRVFETMLNEIKTKSEYHSVKYTYPGPAHLSIGQESVMRRAGICPNLMTIPSRSHKPRRDTGTRACGDKSARRSRAFTLQ